jgi:hypothetical protein
MFSRVKHIAQDVCSQSIQASLAGRVSVFGIRNSTLFLTLDGLKTERFLIGSNRHHSILNAGEQKPASVRTSFGASETSEGLAVTYTSRDKPVLIAASQ